ncbi:MAG: DNA double-strand break repair nuclease NurA [Chloroflexi bacterium]|nr:DNA double-strand break repair nuclease NurA [Chloroflexota bacterium]
MALDLTQVARAVHRRARQLQAGRQRRDHRHQEAVRLLRAWDARWEALRATLEHVPRERLIWRPPRLHDGLVGRVAAAPCPQEYTVLAVDGSHLEPDRHRSVDCYLVNLGRVVIRYGPQADARLWSEPAVYFSSSSDAAAEPDEQITDERQTASDGDLQEEMDRAAITALRTLREMERLVDLAESETADPTLALIDGSLFWNLGRYLRPLGGPGSRERRLLTAYAGQLRRCRELARRRRLVLAGYVSFPGSHEVDDALRLAVCPDTQQGDLPDCTQRCPISRVAPDQRPCSAVGEVLDRDLFFAVLEVGQRSAVFLTRHEQMEEVLDEADRLCFYYLRTAHEIVRIEVPRWVVEDPELLALSHTLALDQAQRGQGYPAALMEADALAAVSEQDRRRFWELVEQALTDARIPMTTSAKSCSKRLRWM